MPEEEVLADIQRAGYAGAPAGPRRGRSTQETLDLYAKYDLLPAPGYFGVEFWDPAQEEAILEGAKEHAQFAQEAGLTELYVAPGGFASYTTGRGLTRAEVSGHVQPADGMTDDEFAQFAKVLNAVGRITLDQGVRSCFHNHVGAVIETGGEIERLLSMVDDEVIFLGPDTGHLEWGGVDAVQFCRDHAARIKTIHIKDVNRSVLEEGVAEEWNYGTFSQNGIWTELGQGYIDFPTIFSALDKAGFTGWIIVETDVTQLSSPLESAKVSRGYLQTLGL